MSVNYEQLAADGLEQIGATPPAANSTKPPSKRRPGVGPTLTSSADSSNRNWPLAASGSSTPACTFPACRG